MGSSTWDLLSNDGRPPPPSLLANDTKKSNRGYNDIDYEYHIAHNYKYWDDHLVACEQLIQHVRTTYPVEIVEEIFWKSPSSLHIHVPILQLQKDANSVKLKRQYGGMTKLHNRLRYMSSSRAYQLHTKQQQLMKRLNVTYLDVYQATYLSADHTYIGDGRHYLPYLNTMIMNWFYPTSSYIETIWNHYRSMHHHYDDVLDDSRPRNNDKNDDRYFLLGYYSCPISPISTTASSSNDYRVNDENVAVDLVNAYVVAMILNRTLLLKYHDSSLSERKQRLLSEEDCNYRIWNQPKPPSWINLYDDWKSSQPPPPLFNVSTLLSPPKSHYGLSNRDRWLVPVRSNIPMGIPELLSAGYNKSILVINDIFEQDGQNMVHGMLMDKLFASSPSLPKESTARQDRTVIPNLKIESSDAITIAISPSLSYAYAGMNETKLADCLQKLLKDSGLHGHMKCSVLVHPSTLNQHLQKLINDRFNCTTIEVPPINSIDGVSTTPPHRGNTRSSTESTISFSERFSFYQHVAHTIYDGYVEYDCNSGESMVMQRLVHYLRATEARKRGQLPITDIPYCCLQN